MGPLAHHFLNSVCPFRESIDWFKVVYASIVSFLRSVRITSLNLKKVNNAGKHQCKAGG